MGYVILNPISRGVNTITAQLCSNNFLFCLQSSIETSKVFAKNASFANKILIKRV